MAEPVHLCAACREEIVFDAETGRCPGCGIEAPRVEIEAEAEAALLVEGTRRVARLDPEGRAEGSAGACRARFVVKL